MKTFIIILLGNISNAQSKDSDLKDFIGEKSSPLKYVLFDENKMIKKMMRRRKLFYINNQTFFLTKKHKIDTCFHRLLTKQN
jgi:hypothetical protein